MKPKTTFDPMFHAERRRPLPIRSIGPLMIVLTLSGLALRAGPIPRRRPGRGPCGSRRCPGRDPGSGGRRQPQARSPLPPQDRFVIVAPAEIDPAMVVPTRADLDEEMVFNPDTGRRGSAPADPDPANAEPLPDPAPNPARPREPANRPAADARPGPREEGNAECDRGSSGDARSCGARFPGRT